MQLLCTCMPSWSYGALRQAAPVKVCCSVWPAGPVIWRASGFNGAHCREVGAQHPLLGTLRPSPHSPAVRPLLHGQISSSLPLSPMPTQLNAHSALPHTCNLYSLSLTTGLREVVGCARVQLCAQLFQRGCPLAPVIRIAQAGWGRPDQARHQAVELVWRDAVHGDDLHRERCRQASGMCGELHSSCAGAIWMWLNLSRHV